MILTKFQQKVLAYITLTLIIGFILLTVLVLIFPHSFIDREFSEEVQEHSYPLLDTLMKAVSWFGYYPGTVISVVVPAAIFFVFRYRKEALFVLLTSVSGLVSGAVKILVNRPRPTEPLVRIVQKVNQQSFPSGHVLFYTMLFGFLAVLMYYLVNIPKTIRIIVSVFSLLLIFAIPFSRIYLGAHWFTDVLGGFLLGMLCLLALYYFYFRNKKNSRQPEIPV